MKIVTLATCSLDQWAMDFKGNLERIRESIREAKRRGARYRLGPELEISGYGCQDHFLEVDTYNHSMECLAEILKDDLTDDILVDLGIPVMHKNVRYNARVFVLNRKILLVRPKLFLADDGNYREPRWFASWTKRFEIEDFKLPKEITDVTGQKTVPIGEAVLSLNDTELAAETCEELFTPDSPHIALGLDGVEIVTNGSGSHHNLRKLHVRVDLIQNCTYKMGGVYLYSNQQGCDGDRLYYDGCAMIACNGRMIAQGSQFSVRDVEVVTANIDLEQVRAYRSKIASRGVQAAAARSFPRIIVDFDLVGATFAPNVQPTDPVELYYLSPAQEILNGPACWLWDYLRRSGVGGFFLPLSGGADSSSTAAMVGWMCQLLYKDITEGPDDYNRNIILADLRRIAGEDETWLPESPKQIANIIFHTCYMGTENSSAETRNRAKKLADEIGSYHLDTSIDIVVSAMIQLFSNFTGKTPQFKSNGGTQQESIALQNIQARLRMVYSYFLSQLLTWVRGMKVQRPLLVLGSANVDEALRGYYTKYDCSSADINPIGGISKTDLKMFLNWAGNNIGYPTLLDVVRATPTAELEPLATNQSDEADMGMTYDELSRFGTLRKLYGCGPVSMFRRLTHEWADIGVKEVGRKVKYFFKYYSINRHKQTTLTPSYHAESYSPDDNRFDLRQFLYNVNWPWQFAKIDELTVEYENQQKLLEGKK